MAVSCSVRIDHLDFYVVNWDLKQNQTMYFVKLRLLSAVVVHQIPLQCCLKTGFKLTNKINFDCPLVMLVFPFRAQSCPSVRACARIKIRD